jgi:gamma-glutamylcyclotransferase (GGCT)/AIG2-like uncharacterized protein YtfP
MTDNQLYTLFVYGSLRQGFQSEAYGYISRYFTLVGHAKVKGSLYDLGDYPAALPSDDEKFIEGELYRVKNEDEFGWAIEQIDDYEGLNVEAGETPLYRRSSTKALLADGSWVDAWVYWYNGSVEGKPLIESGDVLAYIPTHRYAGCNCIWQV